jgi:hypothetical protein
LGERPKVGAQTGVQRLGNVILELREPLALCRQSDDACPVRGIASDHLDDEPSRANVPLSFEPAHDLFTVLPALLVAGR